MAKRHVGQHGGFKVSGASDENGGVIRDQGGRREDLRQGDGRSQDLSAPAPQSGGNFVYDPHSQTYYDAQTGIYYDPETHTYYDTKTETYYRGPGSGDAAGDIGDIAREQRSSPQTQSANAPGGRPAGTSDTAAQGTGGDAAMAATSGAPTAFSGLPGAGGQAAVGAAGLSTFGAVQAAGAYRKRRRCKGICKPRAF